MVLAAPLLVLALGVITGRWGVRVLDVLQENDRLPRAILARGAPPYPSLALAMALCFLSTILFVMLPLVAAIAILVYAGG